LQAHVSPDERARIEHKPTENLEAYQTHLKGLFLWNQRTDESVNAGIEHFKRAIELDAGFAPAHVGLADSYIALGDFGTYRPGVIYPMAKAAALRALKIDPTLGDAHVSLGLVEASYDWDWAGAEDAFLKAIELRPGYANAHHWYALHLATVGRFDQAIAEIKRAKELDPLSPSIAANVGSVYVSARRYQEATAAIRETIEMHPQFPAAHWYLGVVLLVTDACAEAIVPLRTAHKLSSGSSLGGVAAMGYAQARLGNQEQALNVAAALTARYESEFVSPTFIALVYLGLGDHQTALEWLDRAIDDRDGWLPRLVTHPLFDGIRDTPEYPGLLRRIGLADP
jgi:tetratricopeptide (TPR) repeat protein